jgi:hypothetical protein
VHGGVMCRETVVLAVGRRRAVIALVKPCGGCCARRLLRAVRVRAARAVRSACKVVSIQWIWKMNVE